MIDGIDGAHVIAMTVLFLTPVALPNTERGSQQRGLDIMNAQGVSAQQRVHVAFSDQFRKRDGASRVYDHRTGHGDNLLSGRARVFDQGGGLLHGRFHLAFRGYAVAHEGERETIAFLRFGNHADAAHSGHHLVAGSKIAHAPAPGLVAIDYDHGVHALVLNFHPLVVAADIGSIIGSGVKIFGSAAVAFDLAELGVAGVDHRAAEAEQLREHLLHRIRVVGIDL